MRQYGPFGAGAVIASTDGALVTRHDHGDGLGRVDQTAGILQSTGIPFPGETTLLAAATYAGTTHHLSIALVIVAAASGAILGDNLGFWVGREGGYRLLRRYGRYIRLERRRLKLGQYLFRQHGGKVVFFGRFVAVLRAFAAFLAGTNRMPWGRFLAFNAAGGIVWAIVYGLGGYALGRNVHRWRCRGDPGRAGPGGRVRISAAQRAPAGG